MRYYERLYLKRVLMIVSLVFLVLTLAGIFTALNTAENTGSELAVSRPDSDNGPVQRDMQLSDFIEIIERPLFNPERRASENPVTVVESPPSPPAPAHKGPGEEMVLKAIVLSDDRQIALLESRQGQRTIRIALGEAYNGWELTDIRPDQITLSRAGKDSILPLELARSTGVPTRSVLPGMPKVSPGPDSNTTMPVPDPRPQRGFMAPGFPVEPGGLPPDAQAPAVFPGGPMPPADTRSIMPSVPPGEQK